MDLTATFATDFLCWDGVEQVMHEVARRPIDSPALARELRNPNQTDIVPVSKWRNFSRKELQASLGAYTGADRVCLVPRAVLAPGKDFKPGDVLIRSDESRWTVLEEGFGKGEQTFRLNCRNLVLAFDLRDKIDIERATTVYDTAGAAVKLFPTGPLPHGGQAIYTALPCRVQLATQEIADERGIRGFKGTYAVILSREVVVTNEDRIRLRTGSTDGLPAGTYLEIRDYHQTQTIDNLSVIAAERAV